MPTLHRECAPSDYYYSDDEELQFMSGARNGIPELSPGP